MSALEVIETEDGGHYYSFEGNRVPGVSEILELNDVLLMNSFYEERKEFAAMRGRDVHMATADLDKGMKTRWWETVSEIAGYVKGWELFKSDFNVKITAIETPLYHEIFRYAGTPDRFGQATLPNGVFNITPDIKCVSKIGPHVPLQLAGYNLFCDDYEDRIPVAVQLKPDGKYRAYWYDKERAENHRIFLSALTMALWKNRAHSLGLYK